MKKYNYHTHTYRCGHAQKGVTDEDFVKEFIKNNFDVIAFTDHCPEKEVIDNRERMRMDYSQKDEYLASINYLKEEYKDQIKIESGYEIEYLPGQEENLFELKNETDKIVLGQHFIYDEDNKNLKIFRHDSFNNNDLLRYAEYLVKAMKLGLPDMIVHPDIYIYANEEFGEIEAKSAHMICEAAEKYNVPLEINLTEPRMYLLGLRKKIIYPSREFWNVVSNYDITVLYGIDAHYIGSISSYEESIKFTNEVIGEDIVKKLKFLKID